MLWVCLSALLNALLESKFLGKNESHIRKLLTLLTLSTTKTCPIWPGKRFAGNGERTIHTMRQDLNLKLISR
jgi:hypothetical protein